jgi:hypothetical protein
MKFVKSILMGTGAVVLAGLILTLLAPKAAHAIVATAVSVVNTSSNPVPASLIDDPGRIPFVEQVSFTNCPDGGTCQTAFTTPVPAGHRVVITNVSLWMEFLTTFPTAISVDLNATVPTVGDVFLNVPVAPFINISQYFGAPVTFYFDAGQIPLITVRSNGIFGDDPTVGHGLQEVTLVGYELDCTVAPCAAIATQ